MGRYWADPAEGPELAVVVLFLWLATAVAGLTLLRAGSAARLAAAPVLSPAPAPVRVGAAPLTAAGIPPPIPHAQVSRADSARTLLEFSHPALAVTGIGCWMMFTFVRYLPLAWIAFGVLVATLLLGLGWLIRSRHEARHQEPGAAWSYPPRLVWLHGAVAGSSILLTVLTALIASRA